MKSKDAPLRAGITSAAIFAGLVETVGLIVLPSFDASLRETFLWFLMAFPVLVVLGLLLTTYVGAPHGGDGRRVNKRGAPVGEARDALREQEDLLLPDAAPGFISGDFQRNVQSPAIEQARTAERAP